MQPITEFFAPETVDEAVGILSEKRSAARVLAGGTDVMVRLKRGDWPASCATLVSVHRIAGMRGCRREDGELVIGATTTASDLIRDPLVAECASILVRVADRLASNQIRNMATIGGNLANASPAGDLISPLLLLDARLVLASTAGRRAVPVGKFFTGPGETVMRPDELLVEVRVDVPPAERVFRFEKAGTRPAMECSVVTVGLAFTRGDDRLTAVRVAFGSSAPTPLRGLKTEAVLEGQVATREVIERAVRTAEDEVSPISDIRGSERYRRALAGVFLRRLLHG
jgi:CO/xanthine dehydrogenase FAD-binding subunit